jgi:hypothetical protein
MGFCVPDRPLDGLVRGLLGALAVVGCTGIVLGQDETVDVAPSSAAAPPSATTGLNRLPRDAFQTDPEVGVRYRSIFRDTGAPYTNALRPIEVQPSVRAGNVESQVSLALPNISGRFPLLERGFEPTDADLKAGPFFFKLRALSGAVLASDNINRTEEDEKSDVIGIVRVGGTFYAQLTEGLRIATSGNLVWLPFEGTFGVSGFGLVAPYTFGLEGIPAAESQIVWDTMIGGWNVVFEDDFRLGTGRFSVGSRDDFELFEGGQFDDADRAGRYVFRAPPRTQSGRRFAGDNTDLDIPVFSNVLSVTTERLFPGPIRLRVRAFHENLWYNQGQRGLPKLRDSLTAHVASERDNQRFKPFAYYRATHTDLADGFNHQFRLGINGPITDQVMLHADVGWFHSDDTGADRFLWRLDLDHLAGPYTTESVSLGSEVGDFTNEYRTYAAYRLHQIIGPKLTGETFATIGTVEDLDTGDRRDEFRTGVRVGAFLGPRTALRGSGIYSIVDSTNEDFGQRETWTLRLELTYHFTDSLFSRLVYQYQIRDSSRPGDSYDENLVFLSLTKYFD